MYASKSTRNFYYAEIHGARRINVPDPAWIRPTKDIVVQPGESAWIGNELVTNAGDESVTYRNVPDMNAIQDTLEIVNPDCLIPDDAVEITTENHAALLAGESAGRIIVWGASGYPVLVDPPEVVLTTDELCAKIDASADMARAAVAGDPLRAVEYQRSADEAQAFKDAGYPADAVPPMVAAWAIGGRTAKAAADNILAEAKAYNDALVLIRTTRLAAKEQVRTLMADDQYGAAKTLTDQTVAAIEDAVAGIGNNAGTP